MPHGRWILSVRASQSVYGSVGSSRDLGVPLMARISRQIQK